MGDYNEHIPDGAGDNGDADELVYQSEGCGKAAHCPLKRLGKGYTAVNIIGVAVWPSSSRRASTRNTR